MALRTIHGSQSLIYSSKMTIGETVQGYYAGIKAGEYGPIILLDNEDGSQTSVLTSGNLKYIQDDFAKHPESKPAVGDWLVITKSSTYKNKKGTESSRFLTQIDDAKKKIGSITPVQDIKTASSVAPLPVQEAKNAIEARLNSAKKASA